MKFAVMVEEGRPNFNNTPTRFHGTFEAAKEQAIAICKKSGMKTYILKAIAEVEFKITALETVSIPSVWIPQPDTQSCITITTTEKSQQVW